MYYNERLPKDRVKVSRSLFPSVIKCVVPKNPEVKKLMFAYLVCRKSVRSGSSLGFFLPKKSEGFLSSHQRIGTPSIGMHSSPCHRTTHSVRNQEIFS